MLAKFVYLYVCLSLCLSVSSVHMSVMPDANIYIHIAQFLDNSALTTAEQRRLWSKIEAKFGLFTLCKN